jgi:hypothetical protein
VKYELLGYLIRTAIALWAFGNGQRPLDGRVFRHRGVSGTFLSTVLRSEPEGSSIGQEATSGSLSTRSST